MSTVAGPSSAAPGPGQPSGASPPSSLSGSPGPGLASHGSNHGTRPTSSLSPSSPSFPNTATPTTSSSSQFARNLAMSNSGGSSSHHPTPPSQPSPRAVPTTASTSVMTTGSTHVIHPNLPSPPSSPEQTAQARAALVGTISNLLDSELQGRASLLHANAKALEGQERDVVKATEALRRETDKLVKVVKQGSEKVREAGDVQNWAEVLERDFLVLEDTLRQVRRGSGGCSDPDCSGCSCSSGSSWSGSRTPSRRGSLGGDGGNADGSPGKGKGVEDLVVSTTNGHRDDDLKAKGIDAGEPAKLFTGQDGSFASVNNAIAASISEAMASSISDRPTLLPSASSATESGSSILPSGSTTVVNADGGQDKGKGVFSTGDVTASSSSLMELDEEYDDDRRKEVDFDGSPTLEDREVGGLDVAGLMLQAEQAEEAVRQSEHADKTLLDVMEHDLRPSELPATSVTDEVEDMMDIDEPSEETQFVTVAGPGTQDPEQMKDDTVPEREDKESTA
ncbi:hypothetical protein KJ359_011308 [Pestalotiopsis sp. 9143b]|nr:hypothetical protein KJ359_011308 [Pestalotiopsis sp. 9143b]